MKRVLLKNAYLLNEDAAMFHGDILISCGRIEKIIRREDKTKTGGLGEPLSKNADPGADKGAETDTDTEVIDCTGRILTPGLTNLHAHSPMHILRGLAEDVNIDDWFNKKIWPYESKLTPEDIYCGAMLCMAEMIDNGVTAFADHYFECEAILRAAKDCGIRIDLAPTIFCPEGSPKEGIIETESLLEKYEGEKIHIRFGPHSPYAVSRDALFEICAEAKKMHTGIHLHISETSGQVEESRKKYGMTPISELAQCGGMEVPCILAHAIYLEEGELPCLGEDAFIASSPKTYMKLGMGTGNIWKLNEKIRAHHAIGTDGAASSNTVDVLEEARLYALAGKADNHAEEFRLKEIWKLLMNGANAMPFHSGRMKEGCAADLCFWNLRNPSLYPVYDPLATMIYSAVPSRDITDVMIGGTFVKRNGKLLMETDGLLRDASRRAEEIAARGTGKSLLKF